jgi:hypothetical protein
LGDIVSVEVHQVGAVSKLFSVSRAPTIEDPNEDP